ncbi:hypothetical protein [Nannocystis sp. SCPEA4]|uniref:hypothetical protein n=1 Tax=Nannocystis sp. SCPEA4 TaxID=2996787 RepID=UPI0022720EDE|nr:hypothetical protein [Nannocystis sp. SCPEA4]MCY1057964.1 hypothetical protein [Nannocystis sp. SCPEA4]
MRLPFLALFCLGLSSAPLVASAGAAPTAETAEPTDGLESFRELDVVLRPIAERLLASDSEDSFLASLDAELFRTDPLTRLFAAMREFDGEALVSVLAERRTADALAAATDAAVAVTSRQYREEIQRGFADAAKVAELGFGRPESPLALELDALSALEPDEVSAAALRELGDARHSLKMRAGLLAIFRSNLCMAVLAVASDTGIVLPSWMAELSVRMWRQGQELVLAQLESRPAPALREERLTPLSRVMLSFCCDATDSLGPILVNDPTAAPLLQKIADHLPRFFADTSINLLNLRPGHDVESSRDTLVVEVQVARGDPQAWTALDRFDRDWWLDAASESATEIIVDIRRT